MRDFQDAKAMAQTLRETMAAKGTAISHSESLELIAKIFGVADWNTLSAKIRFGLEAAPPSVSDAAAVSSYAAIPIRDFVPFPKSTFPLYVGREKTKRALDEAFRQHRDIVLVIQKASDVENPTPEDIFGVGVFATLLEADTLPGGSTFKDVEVPAGVTKVLLHAHRRVEIRRFLKDGDAFRVEIDEFAESATADKPEFLESVAKRFDRYAADNKLNVPPGWLALTRGDAGRFADFMAQHMQLPVNEKVELLAARDPVTRIEKITAMI